MASTQEQEPAIAGSDTGRAEAFSDAVLAIIITLLVLDLRVPQHRPGQLLEGLLHQWPTYVAYAASYVYVAVVWLNHKAAFQRIKHMNRGLHWANLGTLATTALLPWPTSVVSDTFVKANPTDTRTAVALYALVGAALCLSWWFFFQHLAHHPELTESDVDDDFFPRERHRALAGIVLYLLAGIGGYLLTPIIGLVVFALLPAFYAITSHGLSEVPDALRKVTPLAGD